MADFSFAVNLIRKYEGFHEKAYPNPTTGKEPYTIGYGTQFYPDGSPVKMGQRCTEQKALEYLFNEIDVIYRELLKLNLNLDNHMIQGLISFIHSIGWEPFLYSNIIDCLESDSYSGVCEEISRWIFDENYQLIGGLLDRRREEINLFLNQIEIPHYPSPEILLKAFEEFTGSQNQIEAVRILEQKINPYTLSEFSNNFRFNTESDCAYIDFDFTMSKYNFNVE